MIKKLTKHGNSYALVIDKAILDLLKIRPNTPLEIATDGKSLLILPLHGKEDLNSEKIQEHLDEVNRHTGKIYQRLGAVTP